MSREANKILKKLICAGIVGLVVLAGTREARAELLFENIPVTTAPGDQIAPAIWGNYIVWMGAENEAYDIAQGQIVQMPGLNIDGVPAIWENKVVYEGGNGYYDIDLQQMVYPEGLSVGEWPAIHNNKIVWSDSTGYYDLNLEEMIYPSGLSVGDDPDIFGDKIVWSESTGYYDIGLQGMVYPEGLSINRHPAIYDNKIVWQYLTGVYYDIDLQQYVSVEGATGSFCSPDIFEDSIVWNNYDAVPPITIDVKIWEPVCKQRQVTESGCAAGAKIYDDIVVWSDWRNENGDIYMARIIGCCGDPNHPYPGGDLNQDCLVNMLDFTILANDWMNGFNLVDLAEMADNWLKCTAPECGVQVTDVQIIRGELVGGWFQAIEEVDELIVGDVFVITTEVTNLGSETEYVFNMYGWDLSPENSVEVIGSSGMCVANYDLQPGESAVLYPFCLSQAFKAEEAGGVTMNIYVKDWVMTTLCGDTFTFEVLPAE